MSTPRQAYADLAGGEGRDIGTLRWQYTASILILGDLEDLIAYGRAMGLEVQDYRGGGWLVKRGWIVATGERRHLRKLLRSWMTMAD